MDKIWILMFVVGIALVLMFREKSKVLQEFNGAYNYIIGEV